MDVKQYLESLRLLDARIDQRVRQLDDIGRRRSYIMAAGLLGADRRNAEGSESSEKGVDDVYERGRDMLSDMRAEISEMILRLEQQRNFIIGRIQSLNDHKFVQVLYKRYVEYKPFEQIAAELGYARSHTLLLHRNALAAFEAMFGSELRAAS